MISFMLGIIGGIYLSRSLKMESKREWRLMWCSGDCGHMGGNYSLQTRTRFFPIWREIRWIWEHDRKRAEECAAKEIARWKGNDNAKIGGAV